MGLTNRKEEQLRRQPIIETRMWKHKEKNLFIVQTVITEIKPVTYVEKVLSGSDGEDAMMDAVLHAADVEG